MNRHQRDGLAYYTFPSLETYDELVHAVTTRHGGVSTGRYAWLNLTKGSGDDPAAVEENLSRVCAALGLERDHLVSPNQRHTANVRRVSANDRGRIWPDYDALVTDQPGVPLLLRFADCVPVLIYDPLRRALGLVHSGWRGTVQGVVQATVAALRREFGSRPADLIAAIGPSIGPCCYQVGDDVADAVRATFTRPEALLPVRPLSRRHSTEDAGLHHAEARPGHTPGPQGAAGAGIRAGGAGLRFDLWAANRRWLIDAGVSRVEVSEMCTACRTDEFYSYRAERGITGHFGAVMSLAAP